MMYDDKYENHFLNIECGRARFTDFGTYTLHALLAPGLPAALAALAPALQARLTAFGALVVTRTAEGGTTQDNTATEDQQWELVRAFVAETDVVKVKPAYFRNAEGLKAIYPHKLSGLTQATKGNRLARFEAYTQALEAAAPQLTAAPGQAARALLNAYRAVAATKDTAESNVSGLIKLLGPEAEAVCWALWDVHCTALATYSRNPPLARALFNYNLLPTRKRGPVKGKG